MQEKPKKRQGKKFVNRFAADMETSFLAADYVFSLCNPLRFIEAIRLAVVIIRAFFYVALN